MGTMNAESTAEVIDHRTPARGGDVRHPGQGSAAAPARDEAVGTEAAWPSECERLARINTAPGGVWSIGEQYLAAFFVTPPRLCVRS